MSDSYPKTAAEWLQQWDAGGPCWSVEMGGIGPGYEQAIQTTAAEIIRWLVETKNDHSLWADEAEWKKTRDQIDDALSNLSPVKTAGLTGAQWGAAMNLATIFYRRGPEDALSDEAVADRKILVRKNDHRFEPAA